MNLTVNSIAPVPSADAKTDTGISSAQMPVENAFQSMLQQSQSNSEPDDLATSEADTPKLVVDNESIAKQFKPSIKQFMEKSGLGFQDASELLYGVVGSNAELRNWHAIMASSDPVISVRHATAEMYGFGKTLQANDLAENTVTVATSGNFTLRQDVDEKTGKVNSLGLFIIDRLGQTLRSVGEHEEDINRNAWLFGLDSKALEPLVEPAKIMSAELGVEISKSIDAVYGRGEQEKAPVELLSDNVAAELKSLKEQLSLLGSTNVQSYQHYVSRIQALEAQLAQETVA